ncbi:MAG: FAD-dependent oxidoreductase [Candidatus Firestonebacteria bacterium]
MKYVIIGYSVAAVSAIKAIREKDKEGSIEVVSNEALIYSRPLISYFLAGKVNKAKLGFTEKNFEKEMKVTVYFDTEAKNPDFKAKTVTLSSGKKLSYDKLLICTGGAPIKIPLEETQGVFTFTKLSDAQALEKYIAKNKLKNAVILGGGLIGMKAAEALLGKKMKFSIVDIADRLLANTFDKEASDILEAKLAGAGCQFIKGNSIKKLVTKAGKLEKVMLNDGKIIKTGLLIMAVGVRPDLSFVKDTAVKTNKGIVVDNRMQTSVKDVFSAGDVAEGLEFLSGSNFVIAIWPTAAKQGRVAGLNMAGTETEFQGSFAMNSVEILGVPSISFGITNPAGEGYEVVKKTEENRYKKMILKNNILVGVILVNCIERAGIYGLLIKEKLNILGMKKELLKDDFGFLLLPKNFRKHYVTGEGTEV